MNVKQLKQMIANLPDETPVLLEDRDHSYRSATGTHISTLCKHGRFSHDFGEALTPEAVHGTRRSALLID